MSGTRLPTMSTIIDNLARHLSDLGLLALRLGMSAMMLTHGVPKLRMLLTADEIDFADPIGIGEPATLVLAVLAEVVAPIFIAAGLWTRWAAIPVAATMAVAAFMVHSGDPLDKREPALLFLIGFGTIMCTGAGHFSIDSLRVKRGV